MEEIGHVQHLVEGMVDDGGRKMVKAEHICHHVGFRVLRKEHEINQTMKAKSCKR